jgi:lipoxygenase homology domain-containing protein 1
LTYLDSGRNDFERNQTDVFGLECDFLGELTKITIGHDNKGIGASWYLDKVEIFSERENKNCKKK